LATALTAAWAAPAVSAELACPPPAQKVTRVAPPIKKASQATHVATATRKPSQAGVFRLASAAATTGQGSKWAFPIVLGIAY
jgi:hypothetical protein